jgi:hypothetical protein
VGLAWKEAVGRCQVSSVPLHLKVMAISCAFARGRSGPDKCLRAGQILSVSPARGPVVQRLVRSSFALTLWH